MERAKGIEPSSQPWEGRILPVYYARNNLLKVFPPLKDLYYKISKKCDTRDTSS